MRAIRSTLGLLVLVAACSGYDRAPTGNNPGGGETTNQISVLDNFFSPSATTVPSGTTVTWTWAGGNPHDVTFNNNAVGNSPTQTSGTFQRTFNAAGTYAYRCNVHGQSMSGTVTVQ
jgi:plastocyanin